MLTLYHSRAGRGEPPADLASTSLPANVAWLDLLNPVPDETAFVARTTGLDVPTIDELSEIESSSRLRHQNGAIYLSAPLVYRAGRRRPPFAHPDSRFADVGISAVGCGSTDSLR